MRNLPERYLDYYRNNPEGYWFKRKLYGLGWVPVRSQGWVTIAVFLVLSIGNALRFEGRLESADAPVVEFLATTGALVFFLLVICWRTGEPLKWQWGLPKENVESEEKK